MSVTYTREARAAAKSAGLGLITIGFVMPDGTTHNLQGPAEDDVLAYVRKQFVMVLSGAALKEPKP